MHQNYDQPPVAKASRRGYPQDLVDKGFLDFLLADSIQLSGNLPPPQQQVPFDLPYAPNAIAPQPQTSQYNNGPYMSQQHTFQWVPTPGAGDPVTVPELAAPDSFESVGYKHKRHEEPANVSGAHSADEFGLNHQSAAPHDSGEHSGSDFEDNKKLTKAERTARMREKNKTAQKRWRDRQKAKLTDSEKKLAEMSAKLEHLSIEKAALENRNNILEKVLVMRDQELGKIKAEEHSLTAQGAPQQMPFTMQDGYKSNSYLTISVRDNARITCEELKNMAPTELTKLWKDYVNKLAVMLLEARGNDHSAVQATIDKLVTECAGICASLAMSNPSAIRTMHCSNFDGAMIVQQGPSSSKWLSISRSINLTPQQKKELLAGRHYYLTKLADVLRRRQALLANLEVLRGIKTTQHALAIDYVTVATAIEKLQANIQEDHQLICGFMYATWKKVLTLFQRANVIVQSYPYFPDLVAIANAIAADDHATAAEALLQQPAADAPPVANDTGSCKWLIAPKQEDDLLCTMNFPLMASMISPGMENAALQSQI